MRKRASLFFGRHRVRATFYHLGFILFLIMSALDYYNLVDAELVKTFLYVLVVVDYFAEMYDPHPDLPGPLFGKNPVLWLKFHFHRMWDKSDKDD